MPGLVTSEMQRPIKNIEEWPLGGLRVKTKNWLYGSRVKYRKFTGTWFVSVLEVERGEGIVCGYRTRPDIISILLLHGLLNSIVM